MQFLASPYFYYLTIDSCALHVLDTYKLNLEV